MLYCTALTLVELENAIAHLEYKYGLIQQVEDYRAGNLETVSLEEVERQLDRLDAEVFQRG